MTSVPLAVRTFDATWSTVAESATMPEPAVINQDAKSRRRPRDVAIPPCCHSIPLSKYPRVAHIAAQIRPLYICETARATHHAHQRHSHPLCDSIGLLLSTLVLP
ncbi:Uncharacterized protein Adt_47774 [Abeliophyllum distichum]|uniref:Uncharacterized protein n=1 Tax=Abeliophyllum distichum TaxID=126358 RepID=A0ABD1NSY9_9LAMI